MPLKLKQEKAITGVPVVEVKISHIATARTRKQNFNQRHLPPGKLKPFIYAAAKKPGLRHSAMAAIINKPANKTCGSVINLYTG